PGEKLYEELFIASEHYSRTRHDKIFTAANAAEMVPADLAEYLATLEAAAWREDRTLILHTLQRLIPEAHLADPAPRPVAAAPAAERLTPAPILSRPPALLAQPVASRVA